MLCSGLTASDRRQVILFHIASFATCTRGCRYFRRVFEAHHRRFLRPSALVIVNRGDCTDKLLGPQLSFPNSTSPRPSSSPHGEIIQYCSVGSFARFKLFPAGRVGPLLLDCIFIPVSECIYKCLWTVDMTIFSQCQPGHHLPAH
jgi:hypothetical protein